MAVIKLSPYNLSSSGLVEMPPLEFKKEKTMRSQILLERGLLQAVEWGRVLPPDKHIAHFMITDTTVDALYGRKIHTNLGRQGYRVKKLVVGPGERAKSLHTYAVVGEKILTSGITKHSYVIGLGGGVVNNLAGFIASTLYRGIGLIQVPTTLLSQVDATIDFKQGVNSRIGKNHFGSYYPAAFIVIDPEVLQTVSLRHMRNGFGEVIKHAFTQDSGLFDILSHQDRHTEAAFIDAVIKRTVELKVALFDDAQSAEYAEMVPQYGHAVGHALEHLSHYSLLHGEALAIGMCVMAEAALLLGVCDEDTTVRHYSIMQRFNLPTQIPKRLLPNDILTALRHDKHYVGTIYSVLVSRIGQVKRGGEGWTFRIPPVILKRALARNCRRKHYYEIPE